MGGRALRGHQGEVRVGGSNRCTAHGRRAGRPVPMRNVDFTAHYNITKNLKITLEGLSSTARRTRS